MALDKSILNTVKKNLGLDENYGAFDQDVLTHINSAFFTLYQLGVGPPEGFVVEDDSEEWGDFGGANTTKVALNAVKTYIYLYVRLLFDPPAAPHHVTAANEQKEELIHRLLMDRDLRNWTPSDEDYDAIRRVGSLDAGGA